MLGRNAALHPRRLPVPAYPRKYLLSTQLPPSRQVRALYRGMSPQLVGGALETGVNYAAYQAMLGWTQRSAAAGGLGLPAAAAVPLSAAAAGCVLSFVLSPAELVKVGVVVPAGLRLVPLSLLAVCQRLPAFCTLRARLHGTNQVLGAPCW